MTDLFYAGTDFFFNSTIIKHLELSKKNNVHIKISQDAQNVKNKYKCNAANKETKGLIY